MINEIRNEKGAVTILLLIVFLGIFAFSALLVEGARIRTARSTLSRATDTTIRSTLAGYNSELKETYGIFSYDSTDVKSKAEGYLESNLNFESEGSWNLYDFSVDKVIATPEHTLMDTDILERQILEYMKYRGLVSIGQEVFEKVKSYMHVAKTAKTLEKDQELDEKVIDLGENITKLKKEIKELNGFKDNKLSGIGEDVKAYIDFKKKSEIHKDEIEELDRKIRSFGHPSGWTDDDKEDVKKIKSNIITEKKAIKALKDTLPFNDISDVEKKIKTGGNYASRAENTARDLEKLAILVNKQLKSTQNDLESAEHIIDDVKNELEEKYKSYEDMFRDQTIKSLITGLEDNKKNIMKLEKLINDKNATASDVDNTVASCADVVEYKTNKAMEKMDTNLEKQSDELHKNSKSMWAFLKDTFDSITGIVLPNPIGYMTYGVDGGNENNLPSKVEKEEVVEDEKPGSDDDAYKAKTKKMLTGAGAAVDKNADGIADDFFNANSISGLGPKGRNALLLNEYAILMFNNRVKEVNANTFFDKCEVEYILFGNTSEKTNAKSTQAGMVVMRLVPNTISVWKDPASMGVVDSIATYLASFTGGFTYPAWKLAVILVIATAESGVDVYQLGDGYSIPLFKGTKDMIIGSGGSSLAGIFTERALDQEFSKEKIEKLANKTTDSLTLKDTRSNEVLNKTPGKAKRSNIDIKKSKVPSLDKNELDLGVKDTSKASSLISLDYEDHLRIMLILQDCAGDRVKKLERIQNLIHMNLEGTVEGFNLKNYATYLNLEVTASIKALFFNGTYFKPKNDPINVEYYKSRRKLSIEIMHGY